MSHDPQSPTDAADFMDDDPLPDCCEQCGNDLEDGEGWGRLCGICADEEEDWP